MRSVKLEKDVFKISLGNNFRDIFVQLNTRVSQVFEISLQNFENFENLKHSAKFAQIAQIAQITKTTKTTLNMVLQIQTNPPIYEQKDRWSHAFYNHHPDTAPRSVETCFAWYSGDGLRCVKHGLISRSHLTEHSNCYQKN